MTKQPDFLPEEWVGKPQEEYVYTPRRQGCGWWVVALALLFGLVAGLAGGAALLLYDPRAVETILDFPILSGTERAFDLTAQSNAARATQSALELLATQRALSTREAALNQAATQGALGFVATRTALALENNQRATQSAFSLQGTQAAIYLYATRVQAESLQQQLQLGLNQTATQDAINAAATQAQLFVDFSNTQTAQEQFATATAAAISTQAVTTPTPAG